MTNVQTRGSRLPGRSLVRPSAARPVNGRSASAPTDFYLFSQLLTDEERQIRDRVRAFCDQEVIPVINDYWERGELPFPLLPKLAELGIAGDTIEGYGCPGMSRTAAGFLFAELSRGDGSLNAVLGASCLAMYAIALNGSEEQKQRWLPGMAKLEKFGAFAATEPDHGSDVINMETRAHREGDDWILNGSKRWISNASFADVIVVWARTNTEQVNAFLVEKGTPGFDAQVIKSKLSLRAAWPTHITLTNVRVPAANRLVHAQSFSDSMKTLNLGRYRIAWAAIGHAMACYEYALAHVKKRKQFGKPLASYQLVQQKLARMLSEITSLQALCYRLGQLIDEGQATSAMISLAKMQTTLRARQIAADARDLLGGNGILLENHVCRHMADLESGFTAEGTDHMQALTIGLEITGTQAFF
ncbi:acyl-CoA dehydrogenase family protein [Tengunoibacter tsumagoiensis]|uniref:Acyl-CoA dehydrogenase n=1 Tax=Tengunoibacter tsumagoiensis TaxID=2014871 RepID=A0A402A669_9CHLR|nr:acyl-CoA dehydrogenase family protein [Tengunoibacter tsumagoiensis]GCE14526.1 acyl-CoA dehydrogenase [Tengunoibacter tsumagoiensis]